MSVSRAVVCLPTYNERENLERMVRALADQAVEVLVIDDNSPDGTGEIADRLASELPWVDVLHRPQKEGLGRAYVDGFQHVLASGAELVLEMDCDFSHDPADVPRLIAAVEAGADLALGSRYVPGGGTANWGLVRRLISRAASIFHSHAHVRCQRDHGPGGVPPRFHPEISERFENSVEFELVHGHAEVGDIGGQ